ncbi:MAG: spore germination protein [Clostridia bacterium]|nr:spore germination protein [Clostridia bacterium]
MDKYWLDAEQSIRYREEIENTAVNAAQIKAYLGESDDFVASTLSFGAVHAYVFCIDGLVKDSVVDENILSAFHEMVVFQNCKSEAKAVKLLEQGYLQHASVKKVGSLCAAIEAILSANFVIVFDACRCAFVFDIKGFSTRSIEQPESESVIKGSKDGFIEPIRMNTAIVRRHLRSHHLVIKQFELGSVSKTTVAVLYMKNIAAPALVQAVSQRLEQVDFSALVSLGQVEKAISAKQFGMLPTVMHTERADKLCANILNGKVAVLADGYPVGFVVPANLAMFMQAPEDYAAAPAYASFVRIIRYICLAVNVLLPALYIAVANFSCEILPDKLAQSIMQAKFGMPFSTFTEVVLMLIAFEILIESGLRLPNGVGQAVSIVSGLIVGDAAVSAKLASPAVVMLTAIAGITSFVLPYQSLANALRVMRFALVLAAAAGGLFALAIGVTVMIFYFNTIENFSLPFLTPFSTGGFSSWWKDTIVRRQRSGAKH